MGNHIASLSWTEKWSAKVLSHGRIPKHVALILDGSRRWARINGVPLKNAHNRGYLIFKQISSFLYAIGVEEVTCYAFSLDNFSRTEEEIQPLMRLFEDELEKYIKDTEGMRFRFMGQKSRFSESIQRKFDELEELSKSNPPERTLNFAIAYTSQDDITQAMRAVSRQDGDAKDISVELLEDNMFFSLSSKVEILIRTSGETRISNFMMWEVSFNLNVYSYLDY